MAFIVAAGIHYAVKGVQSGIQAHKDYKSDQPPEIPRDRWGHPKDRHPVYKVVMKAEERLKGGKGKSRDTSFDASVEVGDSGAGRKVLNKEEYESENTGPRTYRSKDDTDALAPPSYETAVSTPNHDIGPAGFGFAPAPLPATGVSTLHQSSSNRPIKPRMQSSVSTASSVSDSESDSDSENEKRGSKAGQPLSTGARPNAYSTRREHKLQRRVARAQRRLDRANDRAERNVRRGRERDLDIRKIRKAEWKLESAERRLGASIR